MKIYLLTQNERSGYDTYDSVVVCAQDETDAKNIMPYDNEDWALSPDNVRCEEIGEANDNQERGIVCASFNAG